jgi:undecaprenyl-diphosphatase
MAFLLSIDTWLFYIGNHTFQNPVFDWLMPFITEKYHWFPVWGLIAVWLLWKGGRQGRIMVLLIIPIIFLSDQISAHVIKPLVARPRPCVILPDVRLLTNIRTSFSFPSAHAANFFAVAAFLSYFYKKYRWWFYGAAGLVAYSRIYIGIHYPFDAVAGALLGVLCAYACILTWKYMAKQITQLKFSRSKNQYKVK